MTTNEKMKLLQTWETTICGMESEEDKLRVTLQPDPDSPFVSLLYRLETEYTKAVAKLVGDDATWLEWYWQENGMGAKNLPARSGGGQMKPVDGLRRLLELIEPPVKKGKRK